jgi:hypothetical protein
MGFSAIESVADVNRSVGDAVMDALAGQRPRHVVNSDVTPTFTAKV